MKNLKIYFGAALMMLLATQCNFFPSQPIEPEPQTNPVVLDIYHVTIGDTVSLGFAANGSAGYQWQWSNKFNCAHVDSVGFNYILDSKDPQNVGGGGTEKWTFKGVTVGTDTLQFIYNRPWENSISSEQSRTVVIHVEGLYL